MLWHGELILHVAFTELSVRSTSLETLQSQALLVVLCVSGWNSEVAGYCYRAMRIC